MLYVAYFKPSRYWGVTKSLGDLLASAGGGLLELLEANPSDTKVKRIIR